MKDQCNRSFIPIFFGVLSLMVTSVFGDAYLKEAPSFLTPCQLSDSNNGECVAKAVENVFTNWRDGVPGLKSLGSIDPYRVKKIHLEQDSHNINLKVDLKDAIFTGLSKSSVIKAGINKDYTFKLLVKIPLIKVKTGYRMKGNILVLQVDSTGLLDSTISDIELLFVVKSKLITVHDHKFFDVQSIQTAIKNVGNFQVHFDNLFNGNAELENSAYELFNENWRDIFEIMSPVLQQTLDALAIERFKKIFGYVPADYFLTDLP
ncbi:protein takeout-like isoform 2-T2 [Cochliomyia hominivorax]